MLTTYSMRKKPTVMLSMMCMATTASGYSGSCPDSSSDWNSGNVPRMNVIVEMMTTLKDVKAMAWKETNKHLEASRETWNHLGKNSFWPVQGSLYGSCCKRTIS